jgi:hypothetical protein
MEVLQFLGALLLLVIGGAIVYIRAQRKKDIGRDPKHPVYHSSRTRRTKKHHAGDNLVHSHSTRRMHTHASDKLWRSSRVKVNEEHWESGVIVANKILTDSELALEDREEQHGYAMPSIDYEPVDTPGRHRKSVGTKGGKR